MCTGVRFSDAEGNMYFGRNLDWSFSYGETILVTPRAYKYDYVFEADVFRLRQRERTGHRGA